MIGLILQSNTGTQFKSLHESELESKCEASQTYHENRDVDCDKRDSTEKERRVVGDIFLGAIRRLITVVARERERKREKEESPAGRRFR